MPLERVSQGFKDISMTFQSNPLTGDLIALKNETAIARSVRNIVMTIPGERFFQPNFGSEINRVLFNNIDDLSAYYASLVKSIGITEDKSFKLGQNIYRGGNMEYKIQACIACHGPNGDGNSPAGIPVVSGQHAEYIYSQLKNFQASIRSNDSNKMMRNIVHRMTDEEMKAVSQYIQGLH